MKIPITATQKGNILSSNCVGDDDEGTSLMSADDFPFLVDDFFFLLATIVRMMGRTLRQ